MKVVLVLFTLCIGIFLACPSNTVKSGNFDVAENYKEYCSGCHGANQEQFMDRTWLWGASKDSVFASIKYGNEVAGMPAYDTTFTDDEIYELANYILNAKAVAPKHSPRKNQPIITSDDLTFQIDTLVTGMDNPWGLEFLPNGDILITEHEGILYRFSKEKLTEISGLPTVKQQGQGGLMDLKLHPNYAKNGWLYITYSKPNPDNNREATTAVVRAKLSENQLTEVEEIFVAKPYGKKPYHFGGRVEFDQEGYLYITVGDRGERDVNPQSLSNECGKVHRIYDDGRIPKDNPFVNVPDAVTSIWSYGHRNPQGMARHPQTGDVWTHEHGPKGGDEINLIEKGLNYGWPVISYGVNYSGTRFTKLKEKEGMEQPILYWVPSIAPCGMDFVHSDKYGAWQNDILVGSLKFKYVNRCVMEGNKVVREEKLLEDIGRVRVIKSAPDGYIYVGVEAPGAVYRIVPLGDE